MFKIYKMMKGLWWQLLLIISLVGGLTLLQLELPQYISQIQTILTNSAIPPGEPLPSETMREIASLGLTMLGISFAIFVLAIGQGLLNSNFVAKTGERIRQQIFVNVEDFSLANINEFGTASLLTRLTNDTRVIQNFMFMINRVFIMSPVFLIIGSIKLYTLDPFYFYVALTALPIILIIMLVTFIVASPMFVEIQQRLDYVTLLFREGLTGVRVVRAFNQEKRENKFFAEGNEKMRNIIIKVNTLMTIVQPTVNVFFNIAYFGIYFIGFVLLNNVLLSGIDVADLQTSIMGTVGHTMQAATYIQNIMMSFLMLSFAFIMFPQASASAKRINAVLAIKPSVVDPTNPLDKSLITNGVVAFNDVTFSFKEASHPTLENISFVSRPGTTTAIVGSTGSGKSSIINLLPRFHDVSGGNVTVDGHDIRAFLMNDLREQIGFVPQTAVLFSGTIRSNLLFGNENATEEELFEALKVAQAYEFVCKLEKGLDSPVAQGGKNFSGGQKQRLAIARALVKKARIYVFDDSFSALDFRTDIRLRSALKTYAKDSTIFVVAQRVSSILDASQIIVLDEGRIVGKGTHAELLKTCSVYQEIVASQLDPEEINKSHDLYKSFAKGGAE